MESFASDTNESKDGRPELLTERDKRKLRRALKALREKGNVWSMPKDYMDKTIASMPKRIEEMIKRKGRRTQARIQLKI